MEKEDEREVEERMLKQLILTRKLNELRKKLDALRTKDADFETRKAAMKKREEELEAAINEITDETPKEDQEVVDQSVTEFENDKTALETEEGEHDKAKKDLEKEIQDLQKELDEVNSRAADPDKNKRQDYKNDEQRKDSEKYMRNRNIFGENLRSVVTQDDVKDFLQRTRDLRGQKRAVTGAELTIPIVMLDLLRDNLHRYSKLITKVRLKPVKGKARQNVAGTIPEGIWTEAIGKLNELALDFSQIEVDGYKVGGYIPIPNSTLEDSDLNLASEIMDALGQAIGLAVDKAILYGTGTKMPLGIAKRLAQTAKPADWDADAPDWVDLHLTNLIKIDTTDLVAEEFFAALLLKLGVAKPNYSDGKSFWCMNRKTRMKILSNALTINAAGAIVAGVNGTMPIEGGEIVELDFIPDGDIIGGFGSLYLLAEREGSQLAVSEHVKFIEDQTVFKGTARYDGAPAKGEGFVIINIDNAAPTTAVTFAADTANAG
ncbi:phage major capsid protein [Pseudobacteroides cellulosolvens]|uniref:Phage major capsid protein, HK97 family n=1 Tax=Pseudobacteroides cellulosolvens ATCC 35603 = DSM 2933 TaxID=398512 RepID=A0A0L6JGK4_9FIRM|nr:phage major capsid protein [Pseudobacteroides cellulosolvens]KNY24839.1 phage major capsid protein, HK97 family [Pseudobacteroides cellulosolvens ATCC 35603 = DSM 2933]